VDAKEGGFMQFGRVDGFLFVSRISGPKHNLLQLKVAQEAISDLVCEELPPLAEAVHQKLDCTAISSAVCDGVAAANSSYGTSFHPVHIRYVADDTGPEGVYRALAEALVAEVASGRLAGW
jgi:hypothetical protein